MFRALLTIASAATITNTASHAFDTVSAAAVNVSNVYAAAGQILEVDYNNTDYGLQNAEANLYSAAASLENLADYARRGEQPSI